MAWIVVETKQGGATRAVPAATIGWGRIDLNVAACNLIAAIEQYNYAELMLDSDTKNAGIRFLREWTPNSVPLKRKICKGKTVGGLQITSKEHMRELFGEEGVVKAGSHRRVLPDPTDSSVLIVSA